MYSTIKQQNYGSRIKTDFKIRKQLTMILVTVGLSGCVTTEIPPTIAHTHIGHTLTGWPDTPNKQGLLSTAEQEATIAEDHIEYALVAETVEDMKEHIRHVIHVLDPEQTTGGPGVGYGMCQALELGISHLSYGAESDDASSNLRDFMSKAQLSMDELNAECVAAIEFAKEIRNSDNEEEILVLTQEFKNVITDLIYGRDLDSDGKISFHKDRIGLYPLRDELEAMTKRENPKYEPVASRWLFGLFRLPSGKWAFHKDTDKVTKGGSGGY